MDENIKIWLFAILNSIKEIGSYFDRAVNNFDEYQKDIKTKRAVERGLEIIGEAVNRILKSDPNFTFSNARQIIGTRNIR